jgi:hypothetical protein
LDKAGRKTRFGFRSFRQLRGPNLRDPDRRPLGLAVGVLFTIIPGIVLALLVKFFGQGTPLDQVYGLDYILS